MGQEKNQKHFASQQIKQRDGSFSKILDHSIQENKHYLPGPFSSLYDLSSVFNNKAKATKMLVSRPTFLYKKKVTKRKIVLIPNTD